MTEFIIPEKPLPVPQWVLIQPQPPQPDCRTCDHFMAKNYGAPICVRAGGCTNGDKYEPAPKVVLWRTES